MVLSLYQKIYSNLFFVLMLQNILLFCILNIYFYFSRMGIFLKVCMCIPYVDSADGVQRKGIESWMHRWL